MTRQTVRRFIWIGATVAVLAATIIGTSANDRRRFRGSAHATTKLIPAVTGEIPADRCRDEPNQAPLVGLLVIQGAGDIDVLGQVFDEQSHCVRADGTAFNGRFKFTNREGKFVNGRYTADLLPTINTNFDGPAPTGPFLVEGNVCIAGGNIGRVTNDCRAGRYVPARGLANVNADGTGDAVIFIDQTIGIN